MSAHAGRRRYRRCRRTSSCIKEFSSLDEAFGWARHVNGSGRVTLLIDGDDGTSFRKNEIAAALHHPDSVDHAA